MTAIPGGGLKTISLPRVDLRLLVGMLLVVLALGGGLVFARSVRQTTPVVIAARQVQSGQVLTADDLQITQARLEGPLAALAIGEAGRGALVGQTATSRIQAGALVTRGDVGGGPVLAPGDVALTVPVAANTVYSELHRGDVVAVIATSDPGKVQSRTARLLERATVYDVGHDNTRVALSGSDTSAGGHVVNVTLVVPRTQVEAVTSALVNGTITLALAPNTEPRP